jgi:hypothetical protein
MALLIMASSSVLIMASFNYAVEVRGRIVEISSKFKVQGSRFG